MIQGTVRLVWIKAHVGNYGNETADSLAKDGTSLDIIQTGIQMPHQVMRSKVMDAFMEIWHYDWSKYTEARQSKQFYSKPDSTKAKYVYKLSRKNLGRFIRIVTGHNNLNYHRSNVDHDVLYTCRFCKNSLIKESFFHYATDCPSFHRSRQEIFGEMILDDSMTWSVQKLLDFANIPSIDAALGGRFDPDVHLNNQSESESSAVTENEFSADSSTTSSHASNNPSD